MRPLLSLLLFLILTNSSSAQDTLYWSPCSKLSYNDFHGKPDTTTLELANSYIRLSYDFDINNGKLQYTVNCFFLKNISWAKYDMAVLMDHEQTHFDIGKLCALKLEKRFKDYRGNNPTQDLAALYDLTVREFYAISAQLDKLERENPSTDVLQKKFEADIKKQLPPCTKKSKKP